MDLHKQTIDTIREIKTLILENKPSEAVKRCDRFLYWLGEPKPPSDLEEELLKQREELLPYLLVEDSKKHIGMGIPPEVLQQYAAHFAKMNHEIPPPQKLEIPEMEQAKTPKITRAQRRAADRRKRRRKKK